MKTRYLVVFWRPHDNLQSVITGLYQAALPDGETGFFADLMPDEIVALARNNPGVWFAVRHDAGALQPYLMVNRGGFGQR